MLDTFKHSVASTPRSIILIVCIHGSQVVMVAALVNHNMTTKFLVFCVLLSWMIVAAGDDSLSEHEVATTDVESEVTAQVIARLRQLGDNDERPGGPVRSQQLYDPATIALLWIHVPKCGGTALARLAHAAAKTHGLKIAWCYNRGGVPDCSEPKGTLAHAMDLRFDSFGPFTPESSQPTTSSSASDAWPGMIYGHGVRHGSAARWGMPSSPRRHVYVVMLRHPLDRFFSAYGQSQRDRKGVNYGKTVRQFIDMCNDSGGSVPRTPGGSVDFYLIDRAEYDALESRNASESEWSGVASQHLRDARGTIVLLQDRWQESIELLASLGIVTKDTAINALSSWQKKRLNESPKSARLQVSFLSSSLN